MASEIMESVFLDINSRLTESERKEARDRFCLVYGEKYKIHEDLVSLLDQCAKENKISPTNTVPLLEGLTSAAEKRIEIRGIVEQFKHEQSSVIKEWEKHQPSEFVGRDIGWLGSILESHDGVVLWGASGVGKTKLAYTYMKSRNDIDHKVVDLRNIKSMEVIYVETLKQFGKLVSIEDASQVLVANVIKNYVTSKRSLLLLDNADDFVHYPGEGIDLTSEFASLVKSILEESSHHRVKVIITSRQQSVHPDASLLHQEELMSLRPDDASEIIKSRMLHERDEDSLQTDEKVMEAVEQCKRLPLNLKVLAAALQEQGITLESLLPELKKKAEEWKIAKQKERVELPEEDIHTYAVLASRFEQLSGTLQLASVALSLFTRTFSLQSVAAVLSDCEKSKICMIINQLKAINFVHEENESVYDMHPKVREFLIGQISSTPMINEYYVKAKQSFTAYYREQLINISQVVDDDYLRAYDLFMESSSDFNFIFGEKDNEFILVDNFDDNQNIVSLLDGVVKPDERLQLFKNFADTALKRGKILLGTQHLCHVAMAESFFNPVEAFKFSLLRVRHILESARAGCTSRSRKKQLDQLYGLYHYVRGEVLYRMIRVNFSLSDCETAKDSLEKSIGIRERLEPGGSTDIVRSYMNLGNIYNITEDIHRRNRNFDETEPLLEKALDVYSKALNLRKKLSPPNGLHADLPQILCNIGTIWNEHGLLLQMKCKRFDVPGGSKEELECFAKAEEYFKQSLETEKELKLDGLYETSVKLVNMGDVQGYIRKFEDAVKSLVEALELRRMFKGDHEDTVLVLYKLGNLSMLMKKFKEAAEYYKEAFEMDERLPKDFHSAMRKQIKQYLRPYQSWSSQMEEQYNIEEAEQISRGIVEVEKRIKQLIGEEEKEAQDGQWCIEEAMNSVIEALELRRIFGADYEDTFNVFDGLEKLTLDAEKFGETTRYYQVLEIYERQLGDFHSAVRKQIRQLIVIAYQMWGHQAGREESKRIKQEAEELKKRIKELEKKGEIYQWLIDEIMASSGIRWKRVVYPRFLGHTGSFDEAKGFAKDLEPEIGELDRSEVDFQTSMEAGDKYVDGEFNKTGGHVSFKYINASLTIPRNLTEDTQALWIYRAKEEDVKMNLSDSEFLVSDIIRVDSKFLIDLKNPAILEIRCDVLHSRIEKFFELFMLEYNPVSKQWTDVERTALRRKRFYWYNENDYVPIIEGWINRFSMFAVVARPKRHSFIVPPSGLTWRPAEDGRISLAFPSGCFGENADTSCFVKVVYPAPDVIRLAPEEGDLLLSPAINVHPKDIAKPIAVSLPLVESDRKPKKKGFLKILKKEDNYKAEFEIEDINPVFKSGETSIVEVDISGFSCWMMAVWSSREINGDRLKWIGDKMFRHAQYDVNVDVFRKATVDDGSVVIGVACTPFKANDMHWQERLEDLQVSGYEYVNSTPAEERLHDGTLIRIIVEGQYVIAKSDIDSVRFNSRDFSTTPIVLRESPEKDNGGWMRFHKAENNSRLCGIPYHRDFQLVSDSAAECEPRELSKPVRFLGMKLEKCNLECLNALHNSFRNNLYNTGMDEAFVDNLKIWSADGSKKRAVRKLFEEVTRLFIDEGLTEDWFSVFEDSTHPISLRKNLTNVMKILNDQLITREWKKIEAEIESGNEGSEFLGSLTSRLQEIDRQPRLDFKGAMKEYVAKKHTALDLVRRILQVQKDGYLDDVYNVLDNIGRVFEDWMPCINC